MKHNIYTWSSLWVVAGLIGIVVFVGAWSFVPNLSRLPDRIAPEYMVGSPKLWKANYGESAPSKNGILGAEEYRSLDFSDLRLLNRSGEVTYKFESNGYSYHLIALYDCRRRYVSVEGTVKPGQTLADAEKAYAPKPWGPETDAGFDKFFGPRLQVAAACLSDKHPSKNYSVLDPGILEGRSVHEYLLGKLREVNPYASLDDIAHYVLLLDPDGKLIKLTETISSGLYLFHDLSELVGQPASLEHVFAFGGVWLSNGDPLNKPYDVVLNEEFIPNLVGILNDLTKNLSEARRGANRIMSNQGF